MVIRSGFNRLIELWDRYERPLAAISLVIGFVFDLFLARRPDNLLNNILLLSYLGLAALLIIVLNRRTYRNEEEPQATPLFLLLVLQFCFGGLASNMLVLYGKSGTFAGSALFILLLFGMLVGNEFLKSRYTYLRFNIVVYYTLLLTYCIVAVPTFILHAVGTWVFLASGALSLAIIAGFLWLVYLIVFRGRNRGAQIYEVSVLVALVFVFYNLLYFMNIIPPVPLALRDIGVYHSLSRITEQAAGQNSAIYTATYEKAHWWQFWRGTSSTYTVFVTGQAACFSSVFAPTNLSAPIYHRWEKRDEAQEKWMTVSRISFDISGGRDAGYRGFTTSAVTPGRWRCDVETENGALIGRTLFTVVSASSSPALSTKEL
jgi:hypothetical protein